jgi:hypothetical protein
MPKVTCYTVGLAVCSPQRQKSPLSADKRMAKDGRRWQKMAEDDKIMAKKKSKGYIEMVNMGVEPMTLALQAQAISTTL